MSTRPILIGTLLLGVGIASAMASPPDDDFTMDFRIEHCRKLVPNGGNDYFSLRPGKFNRLEGDDDGEFVEVLIEVLDQTRDIDFQLNGEMVHARARIIREKEWIDGELVEISRNYFTRCADTGNIYYLGEDVDIYEDGEIVSHEGEWLAGREGAMPGLIMPDVFLLGARYFQEIAPEAQDRAEHVAMDLTVNTPAGEFEHCIRIKETSPLEPGDVSIKMYAPGIGMIFDDGLKLVDYN